ncbi:hypothetical protein NQ317_006217 [Molorchus minor]|uniref:Secreted protein n=1 Tax=Molorchus minor TaxID=1323400 RepID=A0ABQ9K5F4_9CUCU|nr:hypothetical protein NQ317_006217 [Molorchus minor]
MSACPPIAQLLSLMGALYLRKKICNMCIPVDDDDDYPIEINKHVKIIVSANSLCLKVCVILGITSTYYEHRPSPAVHNTSAEKHWKRFTYMSTNNK